MTPHLQHKWTQKETFFFFSFAGVQRKTKLLQIEDPGEWREKKEAKSDMFKR